MVRRIAWTCSATAVGRARTTLPRAAPTGSVSSPASWWPSSTAMTRPWETVDWHTHPDWPFATAADDTPDDLYALWDGAVERSLESLPEFELAPFEEFDGSADATIGRRHIPTEIVRTRLRLNMGLYFANRVHTLNCKSQEACTAQDQRSR